MNPGSHRLALVLLGGFLLCAASAPAAEDDSASVWGGEHVSMQVTKTGAELDFDCATGTIQQPLPLDHPGKFRLKGTFTQEHGGPVRENEPPATHPATYSGTVDNDALRLRVEVEGHTGETQEYVLKRGHPGRVMKCR